MRNDILENKDKIIQWINDDQSKSYMCREFKCKPTTLNMYLEKMGITYKGNKGMKGKKISNNRTHSSLYLNNGSLITSYKLKNKLIRDNIKEEKCEKCNLKTWNELKIPLELHHIDGEKNNNEITNLQLLCPNCHAQTNTYRSKNCKKN